MTAWLYTHPRQRNYVAFFCWLEAIYLLVIR